MWCFSAGQIKFLWNIKLYYDILYLIETGKKQVNYIPAFLAGMGRDVNWNVARPLVIHRKHLKSLLAVTASQGKGGQSLYSL